MAGTDTATFTPEAIGGRVHHGVPELPFRAEWAAVEREKLQTSSYNFKGTMVVASVWMAFYIILFVHHWLVTT